MVPPVNAQDLRIERNQASPREFVTLSHRVTEPPMNGIIYLVGLVVVILAILSFFGLR